MELSHWPLYGLVLRTPRLELRLPNLEELDALAGIAAGGVHAPGAMPFLMPWTDCPPAERARRVMTYFWKTQSEWTPERWTLQLTVFADGRPIGVQELHSHDFAVTRETSTGSWLGLPFQGRGYGTEMRAAVLDLSFAGLNTLTARSEAMSDNPVSLAVSRKLGYRPDGTARFAISGRARNEVRLLIDAESWKRHRTVDVETSGVDECLEMLGAPQPAVESASHSEVGLS